MGDHDDPGAGPDPLAALGDLAAEDAAARALLGTAAEEDAADAAPAAPRAALPPPGIPDLPIYDEHAMPVVYYECWGPRCRRRDYMAADTYEIYRLRGHRPFCLACQSPDRYKWRTDEQGREYLQPLAAAINRGTRPGEREAQRLEELLAERTEQRIRQRHLAELIEASTHQLAAAEARLAELELEIPTAQDEFDAAQRDPNRGAKIKAEDLAGQLAREIRRLNVMKNNAEHLQRKARA